MNIERIVIGILLAVIVVLLVIMLNMIDNGKGIPVPEENIKPTSATETTTPSQPQEDPTDPSTEKQTDPTEEETDPTEEATEPTEETGPEADIEPSEENQPVVTPPSGGNAGGGTYPGTGNGGDTEEPTQPTEPQPTEPEPTEPKPSEPKPSDPTSPPSSGDDGVLDGDTGVEDSEF